MTAPERRANRKARGCPSATSSSAVPCRSVSDAAQATVTIEATGDHALPDKVSLTGAFADPQIRPKAHPIGYGEAVYDQFVAGCPGDLTVFDTLAGLVNQLPRHRCWV